MNVVIVGTGAVAKVMAKIFSQDEKIGKLTCVSYDKNAAELPHRINVVQGDARNLDSVLTKIGQTDLVINASLPDFNLDVMKSALKAKSNYQDLCSHLADLRHAEQLSLDRSFKKAGLTALINTGVAPGLSNLMAADLVDTIGPTEKMEIITLEKQESDVPISSWSAEVTVDEISAPPLIYRNKRFAFSKPFANPGKFRFPGKIGTQTVYDLYGDEVSTIPLNLPVDNLVFRAGGDDVELAKTVDLLGLLSDRPIEIGKASVSPREFFLKLTPPTPTPKEMLRLIKSGVVRDAVFAVSVRAEGKNGKVITEHAVFPDIRSISKIMPGATYISYPTALAATEFSYVIPQTKRSGVFPPEALATELRNTVKTALRRRNVKFTSSTRP